MAGKRARRTARKTREQFVADRLPACLAVNAGAVALRAILPASVAYALAVAVGQVAFRVADTDAQAAEDLIAFAEIVGGRKARAA